MSSLLNHWQFVFLVSLSLSLTFLHVKVLAQREGDLRLAGYGASRLAGRLEIFLGGEWGTVCSHRDTLDVTKVACRQLGLGHFVGHVPGSSSLRYGLGNGAISLEDVSCRGDDLHLLRCDIGSASCDHHMDISVMCSGILTPYEGEVRLVGGAYASEGVVQINLHHTWSTVCSTDVEPGLATSMCRQLGYTRALSVQQATNVTGQFLELPSSSHCSISSYPCIQSCLPDLLSSPSSPSCSGDGLSAWSITCGISESEFGNATSGSTTDCAIHSTQAEEYEVRLHGNHPDHGRVEVYVEGQWSTAQELRDEEATVICKQLGFPNFYLSLTSSDSSLTDLDLEPVPGSQIRLFCTGLETHVNGCSFSSPDVTDHTTDAYIYCSPILWPFGSLQLVGGAGPFGQLLVSPKRDFQWLCDAHFTMAEAEVACRQMGYANAIRVVENSLLSDIPNASLLHYSLLCSGDEDYLMACQRRSLVNEYCRDDLDFVAIQCGSSSSTGGWRVRLTPVAADNDGVHNDSHRGNVSGGVREGRVEVRLEEGREWGGVCADEFLDLSAHVACRQLGFETYSSVAAVESGGDDVAGHLTSVQCTGFEDLLDYCPHSLATTNCSHLVTINCSDILPFPDGLLRLVNTSSSTSLQDPPPSEGRLEVSYHGLWMSVCGRLFSQEAANVACRQLRFEAPANYCINACFGQGTSDIHFGEYSCHGNESSILDCWGQHPQQRVL
ncbi:Deleted in malignant brain tumors 1 protein [Geodia barretti]|nr:Deleted in malignant brain tumors 1 protein [Geodia barretti]